MVQKISSRKAENESHTAEKAACSLQKVSWSKHLQEKWKPKEATVAECQPEAAQTPRGRTRQQLLSMLGKEDSAKKPEGELEPSVSDTAQAQVTFEKEYSRPEELGVQQGRELLRMLSCPALKPSPSSKLHSQLKQTQTQMHVPQVAGPSQLPEQQQCHSHGRHRRHSSGTMPDQPPQTPILSTSPKPVLPFVAPPLLAGFPKVLAPAINPLIQSAMNPSMPSAAAAPLVVSGALASMPPMPLAMPPEIKQRCEMPPPSFTPRVPCPSTANMAPNFTPRASQEGALAGGTLLSTGTSRCSGVERRRSTGGCELGNASAMHWTMPLPVGLIAHTGYSEDLPTTSFDTANPTAPAASGNDCHQPELETDMIGQAPRLSRSSSEGNLSNATSDAQELDRFIPENYLQSWEFPLSKSEKRLLYTRLCDQERAAAVQECKHLKRRISTASRRASLADTCDGKTSRRVSIADTQYSSDEEEVDSNEQDKQLLEKQRDLERQLADVRSERRRLSFSRP